MEDSLIESKTQYRSSKYETKTSYNTSESGWTRKSSDWEKANSGSVAYVKSWPGGFHTGNALYGTYNKTPVSASETDTAKTVVNSEAVSGYIYWHWCRGSYTAGPINRRVSDVCEGEFQTFHAFYSTSNASSTDANDTNGGDCKYYPNGGCCTDTYWYFQIPVYTQNYTNYKKLFTYERWTDWSDWGDKEISASDTRKVETRTVYRYYTAAKRGHRDRRCDLHGRRRKDIYLLCVPDDQDGADRKAGSRLPADGRRGDMHGQGLYAQQVQPLRR